MNNNRITEYYRLSISQTSKKAGRYSQEDFTLYNKIIEKFKTLKEVEDYLKDYYFHFNGKRSKIYRDTKDGKGMEVGRIYHYKNKVEDNYEYKTYYCQDWIEIEKVKESATPILNIL